MKYYTNIRLLASYLGLATSIVANSPLFAAERVQKDAVLQAGHRSDIEIKVEVMKVLDEFMAAINRKDMGAREATFHFPHYRLASGIMTVLDRPGLQELANIGAKGERAHHSAWDHRRIVHLSQDKVHVDTMFTRYRADGSKIGSAESLYIVTKENGRWGIKMRSSFAD
jgi:hypothetical protein